MKRFEAIPRMLAAPLNRDTDTYWWLVWDWQKRATTTHDIMSRHAAKKLARHLNKHSWLVD